MREIYSPSRGEDYYLSMVFGIGHCGVELTPEWYFLQISEMSNCSTCSAKSFVSTKYSTCRAGQATTLPRQRDHVFRPEMFCLLHHYGFIRYMRQLHLDTRALRAVRWSTSYWRGQFSTSFYTYIIYQIIYLVGNGCIYCTVYTVWYVKVSKAFKGIVSRDWAELEMI